MAFVSYFSRNSQISNKLTEVTPGLSPKFHYIQRMNDKDPLEEKIFYILTIVNLQKHNSKFAKIIVFVEAFLPKIDSLHYSMSNSLEEK